MLNILFICVLCIFVLSGCSSKEPSKSLSEIILDKAVEEIKKADPEKLRKAAEKAIKKADPKDIERIEKEGKKLLRDLKIK